MHTLRSVARAPRAASLLWPYHTTPVLRQAYKDSQDRESLVPRSNEVTQSGRDDEVASENPDAAFNPNKTSPEAAEASAAEGRGPQNPLHASGANQELSKPQGDERAPQPVEGAGKEMNEKAGASGGRNAKKAGDPKGPGVSIP